MFEELQIQADQIAGKLATFDDPEQAAIDFIAYFLSSVESTTDDESIRDRFIWRVVSRIHRRLEHSKW